jgi:hypothetical protein
MSSGRRETRTRAFGRLRRGGRARGFERRVGERGQCVEPASGSLFPRRDGGIFPPTVQQPHCLEASERAIQRAVCRQQSRVVGFTESFRELVTVEFTRAPPAKLVGGLADGELQRDQCPWFSPHGEIIGRYLLQVKARALLAFFLYASRGFCTVATMIEPAPRVDRHEPVFAAAVTLLVLGLAAALLAR